MPTLVVFARPTADRPRHPFPHRPPHPPAPWNHRSPRAFRNRPDAPRPLGV